LSESDRTEGGSGQELPDPTERELAILKVLWAEGEASVRRVYERLREELPIVQNTVQAFLRTMEAKGLVTHRSEGRTFLYRPVQQREPTSQSLVSGLLDRVFDGAVDELVESALSVRKPTALELARLKKLVSEAEDAAQPEDDA
jgi:BlaI family penicillinase repressor